MTGSPHTPPLRSRLLAALVVGALLALLPLVAVRAQEARDIAPACDTATQSEFSDRPEGDFGEAVDCVTWYGIAKGFADGTYGPGQVVTRGQMATFLVNTLRVAGTDLPEEPPDAFTDDDDHTHEDNINIAAEVGIAKGVTADSFAPNAGVRRDQMASFVVRQIEAAIGEALPDPSGDHFEDDNGNTHEKAINQLADAGVVSGVAEGQYNPGGQVTRQQMALFLSRDLAFMTEEHDVALRRIGFGAAVTDGPDLLEVTQISVSASQVTLEYVFDEPVTNLVADRFALYGFDGTRTTADVAQVATGNSSAVRAQFSSAGKRAAYDQATVAGVAFNAVQSPAPEAIGNPEGSAPLQEVTLDPGTTSAPDLVDVDVDTDGTATFTFDEPAALAEDNFGQTNEEGYHLVLNDGTELDSTAVNSGAGTDEHVVAIGGLTGKESQVVRAYIEEEVVADTTDEDFVNPLQAVAAGTAAGKTTKADLIEVRLLPSSHQVEYVFDQGVTLPSSTPISPGPEFRIYYLNGSEEVAESRQVKSGANAVVVATFAEGAVNANVAGGAVEAGAVTDGAADEVGLEVTFLPGDTAAPKLVSAGVTEAAGPLNTTNRSVIFTFDQNVEGGDDETKFFVYAKDGTRTQLPSAPSSSCSAADNKVTCTANSGSAAAAFEAIGNAVLATVLPGAVTDTTESFPNNEGAAVL